MKLEDEIKVVKADIRRLLNRLGYISHKPEVLKFHSKLAPKIYKQGFSGAVEVLEKYLKKIDK